MLAHQRLRSIQGGVSPGTTGVALPGYAIHHYVAPSDVCYPVLVLLKPQNGGNAGESAGGQSGRGDAGHGPPADAVLDHGRVINVTHHGQVGSVVLGDAERVAGLPRSEAHQVGGYGGAGQRAPGAAGLVHGVVVVPTAARAVSHLVAHDHGCQQASAVQPQAFRYRQGGGENLCPWMPPGVKAAVVNVHAVGSVAVGKSRAGCPGALAG
jgi:hypothetical protein